MNESLEDQIVTEKKRRHHAVWRHYLEAWAPEGRLACLQNGRVFPANPTRVAVETDFYELRELTDDDLRLLRAFIATGSPTMRIVNERWVLYFQAPFALRKLYQQSGIKNTHFEQGIEALFTNLEENFYSAIEAKAIPILDSLRRMDAAFFRDAEGFEAFMYFLSEQYMRTKTIRAGVIAELGRALAKRGLFPEANVERAWSVLRHILATNMGGSFALRRRSYWLSFLQATAESQFFTGDQPVVNTYGRYGAQVSPTDRPEKVEIYYPILPTLAALIGDENDKPRPGDRVLAASEVEYYNRLILNAAHQQVFASAENLLRGFILG